MGALLVLTIGMMAGLFLGRAGFVIRKRKLAVVIGDTASQTVGEGAARGPCPRTWVISTRWAHRAPTTVGTWTPGETASMAAKTVVGHRACRICALGMVKTEADGYAFE